MRVDNYTRLVLTVIAVCLVYLCARDMAPPAQAQDNPTRVIITGVALANGTTRNILPVGIVGGMRAAGGGFSIDAAQPLQVRMDHPVEIRTSRPIKVEADRPLPVRAIREPGTQRPGHE